MYPAALTRRVFVLRFEPGWGELHSIVTEWPNRARDEYKPSYPIVAARTLETCVPRNHEPPWFHLAPSRSGASRRRTQHTSCRQFALDDALTLSESPRLYAAALSINSLFLEFGMRDRVSHSAFSFHRNE